MATGKKTVQIYTDWRNVFMELTDDEAGKLIKHFFDYVNDELDENDEDPDDRLLKITWLPIKAQLKRDLIKWRQFAEKQAINGAKGGRPKGNPTVKKENPKNPGLNLGYSEKPKKPVTVTVTDTDTVITDKVKVKEKKENISENKFSVHNQIKDIFLTRFYDLNETSYYWTAKSGAACKQIIKKIKNGYKSKGTDNPTDEQIVDGFRALMNRAESDKFISENFTFEIINSQFNKIISKNGTAKNKSGVNVEKYKNIINRMENETGN